MHIQSLLLFLTIFSIPFGNLMRFRITGSFNILASDVLLSLLLMLMLPTYYKNRHKLYQTRIFQLVAAFIAIGFISLLIYYPNLNPVAFLTSAGYLIRYVVYVNLLFAIGFFKDKFRKDLIKKMEMSGIVTVIIGILQYFFYADLRNLRYIGWDEHLYRLFGAFFDPNFTGAFFVCLALLLLYRIISSKNVCVKKSTIFFLIMTSSAILLTYSRGAYAMFIVSLIVFFAILRKYSFIMIISLLFLGSVLIIPKSKTEEGINLFRLASIEARMNEYQDALIIWRKNPLIGTGFNSYRYAQKQYNLINKETWVENNAGAGVPNSFLFVLATTGIAGLSLYLLFWIYLLKKCMTYIKKDRKVSVLLISTILGVITHSIFDNTLFYPFIMIWIFLLLGIHLPLIDSNKT